MADLQWYSVNHRLRKDYEDMLVCGSKKKRLSNDISITVTCRNNKVNFQSFHFFQIERDNIIILGNRTEVPKI